MRSPSRAMPLGPPYCLDRDSRGRTGCGRRRGGGRETDFTPPGEIVSPAAGARRGAPGRIQVSRKAAPPAGPVRSGSTPRGERQRARLSGACEGHIGRLSGHSSQGPNEPARGRPMKGHPSAVSAVNGQGSLFAGAPSRRLPGRRLPGPSDWERAPIRVGSLDMNGQGAGSNSQGPNEPARGRPGAHRTLPHPKRPPAPLSPRRRRR